MRYIFLLFILMPIIEIAVLIQVGGAIGLLPTLLIIIATAVLGTFMLRQQGLATLNKARSRMASGQLPAEQLMEGVLLLIGGVLLLTPGFVTDAFGFCCLIPVTREWLARRLSTRSFVFMAGNAGPASYQQQSGQHPGQAGGRPKPNDVIEGSFHREDDPN